MSRFPGECTGTSWSSGRTVSSWRSSSSLSCPSLPNRSVPTSDWTYSLFTYCNKDTHTHTHTHTHTSRFHDSHLSYDSGHFGYWNSTRRCVHLMCRVSMTSWARTWLHWNERPPAVRCEMWDLTVFVELDDAVPGFILTFFVAKESVISSWRSAQKQKKM